MGGKIFDRSSPRRRRPAPQQSRLVRTDQVEDALGLGERPARRLPVLDGLAGQAVRIDRHVADQLIEVEVVGLGRETESPIRKARSRARQRAMACQSDWRSSGLRPCVQARSGSASRATRSGSQARPISRSAPNVSRRSRQARQRDATRCWRSSLIPARASSRRRSRSAQERVCWVVLAVPGSGAGSV
ncbi:hypothetical protein [Skermanella aerolata]|uniref:hypothetical protein n=1 Tax=Skermanella aerolata TaxID=393310 RepID=UPI0011BF9712|nr:hypothetical protein [Skermanella aerolata]